MPAITDDEFIDCPVCGQPCTALPSCNVAHEYCGAKEEPEHVNVTHQACSHAERFTVEMNDDCAGYVFSIYEHLPDGTRREVGNDGGEPEDRNFGRGLTWVVDELNRLDRLRQEEVRAAVEAEREACAEVAEKNGCVFEGCPETVSEAIRARGGK